MDSSTKKDILPEIYYQMDDINTYLNYSYDVYMAMAAEELFEIVWNLKRYSLALKREYNESSARARWCYNNILKIGKPLATAHNSYDKDERLQCAIAENEVLKGLQEQKIKFDSDMLLLDDIDKSVSYLTSMLEKLLYFKLERKKDECNSKD